MRPLLCHLHWGSSREPCIFWVLVQNCIVFQYAPLTLLYRPAVHWLWPGFPPVTSPEISSTGGISVGQEILRTQPMETGLGLPLTRGLLMGKGQPDSFHLPLSIVQGLRCVEAFPHGHAPHGNPLTGPDLFPPVRVDYVPIHLCQDPPVGVVHWVQHPFGPWLGLQLSSGGSSLRLGPPDQVGWCWGPSLGGGCGDSKSKAVDGLGASSHSLAMPLPGRWSGLGAVQGHNSTPLPHWTWLDSLPGALLYMFLWRTLFSRCGGVISPCTASRLMWPWV